MFFIDLEGADTDPVVAEAIEALRDKAENVRVLGQLSGLDRAAAFPRPRCRVALPSL